ncbi:MAG TPA: CopD family protein [Chryseosolibacter sp.]|nr:CopD family protein [Chryseosolibacter sp.]
MTHLYLKAVHIIFIVTWFAGLFYMPRLLVYIIEANEKPDPEKSILLRQLKMMGSRLWFGITWPSAIITLGLGVAMLINQPQWLDHVFMHIKLSLVFLLYCYHVSIHYIFGQLKNNKLNYTSSQLRMWNEVSTLFLISIVFLIVLKNTFSMVWGIAGLVCVTLLILIGIRIYKKLRQND